MDASNLITFIVLSGFALGVAFGFIANKTNFCTMGAISDVVNMEHWGRMRAWLLAMAVAMVGVSVLAYTNAVNFSESLYASKNFYWLSYVVGGLCFGVGMTLAGGCANKNLVRLGGGNLRSLVVIFFMGFAAIVTMKGVLGTFRINVLQSSFGTVYFENGQLLPALFSGAGGISAQTLQLVMTAVVALSIILFVYKDAKFRKDLNNNLAALVIGAVVVCSWYVTGHLGLAENPETLEMAYFGTSSNRPESMSFVAPSAYSLEYLAYSTDVSKIITFGIATVLGVAFGSLIYALISKSFRLEAFSSVQDMLFHIGGAILMGFGAVVAAGCTIGQGITGISTLSLGSLLALLSIIAGSAITMKIQLKMME
ncbi:MAG: transporter [Sideroxydans sp. GWF2_59_14]|nr:MAG: transporter [Sideroxydans sp. GWF2_59_14]HAF44756.1 transporter [Gallionellaceae bacterium]